MYQNRMKRMLAEGEVPLGAYFGSDSPVCAEILAQTGVDHVILETEHGPLSPMGYAPLSHLCKLFLSYDVTPLVRVPHRDPVYIGKALDAGAMGVVVPHVRTKEDAVRMVKATLFPPEGFRGCGPLAAANRYVGAYGPYIANSNKEIVAIALIEDQEGIDNFEEIAEVEGLCFVTVGHLDLALSMGYGSDSPDGGMSHPEVVKAREKVYDICRAKGVPINISGYSPETVRRSLAEGMKVVMGVGTDVNTFHQAFTTKINDVRASIQEAKSGG